MQLRNQQIDTLLHHAGTDTLSGVTDVCVCTEKFREKRAAIHATGLLITVTIAFLTIKSSL